MSENKVPAEVDRNMIVETKLNLPDVKFYDVREDPFEIYGLYEPKTEPVFKRMPDDIGVRINKGVSTLYINTSGGRVRFSTDSSYIAIKCTMPYIQKYAHMPLTGSCGFDLYLDVDGYSRHCYCFKPPVDISDGYEAVLRPAGTGMRHYTINFPNYNPVNSLLIGLSENAKLEGGLKYRNEKPVVFYGSSITQGACASHPGNAYENIISRRLNLDFVNLGFSGNAKGEESMARYIADLPMLAFVYDYDHNAPNAGFLRETHCRFYDIIREKNPDIPIIMVSRPDFDNGYNDSISRRDVVIDTYNHARLERGDKNVYYIDGEGLFRGPDEDLCTVDAAHPTDVGFMKMAESIGKILERSLRYKLH